jgi:hypothetical protein
MELAKKIASANIDSVALSGDEMSLKDKIIEGMKKLIPKKKEQPPKEGGLSGLSDLGFS